MFGVLLGWAAQKWYLSLLPETTPYYLRYEMDAQVLGMLAIVTLGTGLVVGLGPALEAMRGDPLVTLKGGGEGGWKGRPPTGRPVLRILGSRGGLLAAQVGLALAVLAGTGMATLSLMALRGVDTGVTPESVLTLRIELPEGIRGDDGRLRLAFDEIRDRVAALPGVEAAAIISHLPLLGSPNGSSLYPEGSFAPPQGQEPWVITKQSQPGYFGVMGISLVDGRDFTEVDGNPGIPPVIIVNEAFARRYWPTERAVGKRVKYGRPDSENPWMEIVGVAADVRHFGPGSPVELGVYEPFHQLPYWRETLVLRGGEDPSALVPAIRMAVAEVEPNAPVHQIQTMEEVWYRTNWRPVVTSRLLWASSGVSLLLASLGVFGVVGYLTGQRRKEFAIRLATGGHGGVVVAHAVRSTLPPVLLGLVAGATVAWAGMRFWSSLLFEIEALDPWVLALCVLTMALTIGIAILLPARKTARLDPAEVLRKE
jgi:putative ABC transport system permease protein